MSRSRLFAFLAVVPVASLVALRAYTSRFDGWGAWGAAPLLLIPVLASAPVTLAGVLQMLRERAEGGIAPATAAWTAVAAIPLLWLGWRLLVTS